MATANAPLRLRPMFRVAYLCLALAALPAIAFAAVPDLSVNDVAVVEGNSGTSLATFTVTLSSPAPVGGVSFDIATIGGSATSGLDFASRSVAGAVIAEGDSSYQFAVTIYGDSSAEADETFTVRASNATGATIVKADGIGTITNDDYPAPKAVIDSYALAAGQTLSVAAKGLLANDSDPSGLSLQAQLVTQATHGIALVASNGSFTYTPEGGYTGTDSFTYKACNTAGKCASATVKLSISLVLPTTDQYLWQVPAAADAQQQGFIRLVNRTAGPANVVLWGLDSAGRHSPGSVKLALTPNEARQLNSQDLEYGNADKGLSGALGQGSGDWTIVVHPDSDVEALAFIRTPDGFLTAMHDRIKGNGVDWLVPVFNPADNVNQASALRLVNTSGSAVNVLVSGTDDAGHVSPRAALTLAAFHSAVLSSADLENGNATLGLVGKIGNGTGKWRLLVSATGRISVQSLLYDPKGYLTNLSTLPDLTKNADGARTIWFMPNAANSQQQGFLRLVNTQNTSGNVTIRGIDDLGVPSTGTVSLTLAANASLQLNAQDLELGNAAKGIVGALGSGNGDWRLQISSNVDLWPLSLVRTPDGFLTTVQDTVAGDGFNVHLPMVNPAENGNQVSVLRIVNPNAAPAHILIRGVDDVGRPAPAGVITFQLAAQAAIELTSVDLESGNPAKGLDGMLGDGDGKWRISLNSDQAVRVMNLLRDPKGYLTDLSTSPLGSSSNLNP